MGKKRLDISHNPEDWKLECSNKCGKILTWENRHAFNMALNRLNNRQLPQYCAECRQLFPKKNGPGKKYDQDCKNWNVQCSEPGCDKFIRYDKYGSYASACKRIEKGIGCICYSCASKRADRTSPEYRAKLRGRICSEHKKELLRNRYKNMTPEQREVYINERSIACKKGWDNMPEEDRKRRAQQSTDKLNKLTPEQKLIRSIILSTKARERYHTYKRRNGFKPGYNPSIIPYIEDILNIRYNTKFRHAETPGGEYSIYDDSFFRRYYADAYSEELNIWVEFDEGHHYDGHGNLKEFDVEREDRIREILGCQIHRIKFDKKIYT